MDVLALNVLRYLIYLRFLPGNIERDYQWHSADQLEYDGIHVFRRILPPKHGNYTHWEWNFEQRSDISAWTIHDRRATVGHVSRYHRLGKRHSLRERSQSRKILAISRPANNSICSSSISSYRRERVNRIGIGICVANEKDEVPIRTESGYDESNSELRWLNATI